LAIFDRLAFPSGIARVICLGVMRSVHDSSLKLVRKREIAEILGVSVRTIENWMNERRIPYLKVDRIVLFDPEKAKRAIISQYEVPDC
tara:strand:- start:657 stop:920 length:264 start_codon:yes stop_codon:yes gene_type:complete